MLDDASSILDDPLLGEVLGGTYRLVRRLGEGGMGAVYEAEHTRLNKRFAVKTLHAELASHPEAYKRFQREAQVTSELGHPHIIEVVDFAQRSGGMPYLVMELLDGEDLDAKLGREGRLPLAQLTTLLSEIASGLAAAHDHGVVHRDLKPQNIFLTRFGERTDFPKILDFGISKIRSSESVLTQQQGAYLGTPQYMAPEQARGQSAAVDARSDVFSLATIVYRALTGKDAFSRENIPAVLHAILGADPAPPSTLDPELPARLDAVLARALAKDPAQRYSSARELATAFADATRTQPNEIADTLVDDTPPVMGVRDELEVVEAEPSAPRTAPAPPDELLATRDLLPQKRPVWLIPLAVLLVTVAGVGWHALRRPERQTAKVPSVSAASTDTRAPRPTAPDAALAKYPPPDASPRAVDLRPAKRERARKARRPPRPHGQRPPLATKPLPSPPSRTPTRAAKPPMKKPATAKPGSAYGEQPMAF